jgi:RNA 3'-terminal phosphate cyclase (ATP)
MIVIDGSQGEGGGQILRTSLSLSMITGTPFRIEKIRAGRRKPGLLRQHLTCVTAATAISGATVTGAELGSAVLTFEPGPIKGDTYDFAIGSAGATTLVFQTVLPALLRAADASRVTLSGGTHNPFAPTFDYVVRAYLPLLARMGATVEATLHKPGYYPAGGGKWHAVIQPCAHLQPLVLEETGKLVTRRIIADVANVPFDVAERECAVSQHLLGWPPETAQPRSVRADGNGNVLTVELGFANLTELFVGFGERNLAAEEVATRTVQQVRAYQLARAPVGPHLCDQLLLPLGLAGAGHFITGQPTEHTRTNIAVIEKFLSVEFTLDELIDEPQSSRWRVGVSA